MATKNEDRVIKCSFCGKTQDQVRNMLLVQMFLYVMNVLRDAVKFLKEDMLKPTKV